MSKRAKVFYRACGAFMIVMAALTFVFFATHKHAFNFLWAIPFAATEAAAVTMGLMFLFLQGVTFYNKNSDQ